MKEEIYHLGPFVIFLFVISLIVISPFILRLGAETTGVCIFKGPFFSGGFFGGSSDGIPLRGIGVEAYHLGGFGGHLTDGAGNTDRLGCFTIKTSITEYFSYTYNGTSYIDQAQPGVILRDNVP